MVVSASYRTDLPGYYARWFENRYRAGFCLVPQPFDHSLRRVPLTAPAVQAYVFWTRNIAPFLPVLQRLRTDGLPFVVQYTITGYPRLLERHVAAPERATSLCAELAERYGPAAVVWRYDPILITSLTDADYHRRQFATLAARLRGATDEVIVSFAQMYRKTTSNLRQAAREEGLTFEDPDVAWKQAFLLELRDVAAACQMTLRVCSQRELLRQGLEDAACIDPARLSRVAGQELIIPRKPHRQKCGCHQSVDLGSYDTCPSGCLYCYANRSPDYAARQAREHHPDDLLLWRPPKLRGHTPSQLLALARPSAPAPDSDQLTLFDDA